MIRIRPSLNQPHEFAVHIDGHLDAASLPELNRVLSEAPPDLSVVLVLSGLRAIDHEARRVLSSLIRAGSRAIGASLYIAQLLQEASQ